MGCKPIFKTAKHHYFCVSLETPYLVLKSAPRALHSESRVEIEKIFSICFKLLINAELDGLVLASRLKKRIPLNLGNQFATLGAKQQAKNAQSRPQAFSALTPSVNRA
jgi:hypothetical protein